ncbi:MAG: hypothetical protein AABX72_02115, partial [Nanoarchaeota archaeon]
RFYEDHRKSTPLQYDPDSNPIFTLDSFCSSGKRTFSLGSVEFKDYFALRNLLYRTKEDGRLLRQFVPLSMTATLETADHFLVLGHRKGNHLSDRYLPPAGFLQYCSNITSDYFRQKCAEEFSEELGIDFNDVSYIGLTGDTRDSFLDTCTFYGQTSLTRAEVQKAWESRGAKDEHSHLIYIPSSLEAISAFLHGTFTGEVNPSMNIHFENGICISGPREILGKRYQQIENGVGAYAAFLSLSQPLAEVQSLLHSLASAGIIEGVVMKNINDEQPYLLSS